MLCAVMADEVFSCVSKHMQVKSQCWLGLLCVVCLCAGMVDEVFSFLTGRIENSLRELLDTGRSAVLGQTTRDHRWS